MRLSIPVAAVLVLGAASMVPAQEAKEPAPRQPAVPSDRLPTLGVVGDLPPEKERFVVEVDAKGNLRVEGKSLDLAGLRTALAERADASREETGAKVSNLSVVLRVDRDLPWQGAQWLMQECAMPTVRVCRILFAALPEDGGAEGAVAAYLPVDRGISAGRKGKKTSPPTRLVLSLRFSEKGDGAVPADAAPRLAAFLARDSRSVGEIDADGGTPAGTVLAGLDAFLRSGVKSVVFKGTSLQRGANLVEALAARPAPAGRPAVRLLDALIPRPEKPVPLKAVARVKGAIAGVTAPVCATEGEDSLDELDEPDVVEGFKKDEGPKEPK